VEKEEQHASLIFISSRSLLRSWPEPAAWTKRGGGGRKREKRELHFKFIETCSLFATLSGAWPRCPEREGGGGGERNHQMRRLLCIPFCVKSPREERKEKGKRGRGRKKGGGGGMGFLTIVVHNVFADRIPILREAGGGRKRRKGRGHRFIDGNALRAETTKEREGEKRGKRGGRIRDVSKH